MPYWYPKLNLKMWDLANIGNFQPSIFGGHLICP